MNTTKPEMLGFSSQRLARINTVMQRYVDEGKLAGIITLVARRNQVVHFEKCGMAELETGQRMEFNTLFRIYSMTKPITSAAILMLLEEGQLRLNDPVAHYIPAFNNVKVLDNSPGSGDRLVEPIRPINIRDLLTHTAGLSYGFEDNVYIDELYRNLWEQLDANPAFTLKDWIETVAQIPLAYQPGTRYRYSMATDVLGYLVEVVAGMPFAQFLQQRIFDPLQMPDTSFYVPEDKIARFAATYGPGEQGGLQVSDASRTSHYINPNKRASGGGGLVSTTGDYLRFAQMLLNQGELDGVRLLGRKTIELMASNCLPPGVYLDNDPVRGAGFGLGVSVLLDLGKSNELGSPGNYGWGGAANTNFWIDRKEDLIGILMLQFMPSETYPVRADFRNLVYQALVD